MYRIFSTTFLWTKGSRFYFTRPKVSLSLSRLIDLSISALHLSFASCADKGKACSNKSTHYAFRKCCESKSILTIFKWPKHLIVLNLVNSGITINKMAKVLITLIS